MRHTVRRLAIACALLTACVGQGSEEVEDPRVGENGLVRFDAGGCNGSTTLAVGATVTVALQPAAAEAMPDELKSRSERPDVIEARDTGEQHQIQLTAKQAGSSRIELLHQAGLYDWLTFKAEPAAKVLFEAPQRVFVGGSYDVVVTGVYGACQTDQCPLIGHSFLGWGASSGVKLLSDAGGTASFRAGSAGEALVVGKEPVSGAALVQAPFEIVGIEGVTAVEAVATTLKLEEGDPEITVSLPADLPPETVFCIQLKALRGGEATVPLSRRDVRWSSDSDQVMLVPMDHAAEPMGSLFMSGAAGTDVTLTADIDVLHRTETFVVRLR